MSAAMPPQLGEGVILILGDSEEEKGPPPPPPTPTPLPAAAAAVGPAKAPDVDQQSHLEQNYVPHSDT